MIVIIVDGADATLNTNYEGKAKAGVNAVLNDGFDFVYIHVEAPDEMGHQGSIENKIKAIEYLDEKVIKIVYDEMKKSGVDFRLAVLPDHPTPISCRTHTSTPVPYMIYDSTNEIDKMWNYNEKEGKTSGNYIAEGHKFIDRFFEK